jgi:SpoVK/Ycf46/Vps4 family AAA+-type ATPase
LECEYIANTKKSDSESIVMIFLDYKKRIIITVHTNKNTIAFNVGFQIVINYDVTKGSIQTQLPYLFNDNTLYITKKKSNINLLKNYTGHLEAEEFDLLGEEIDLELNYGSEFIKKHELMVRKLNEDFGKGLVLLHGDPGTGKTTYIKHLTSLITDKEIIFVPPSVAQSLSEPNIIPFLMDYRNSILIIEDAETVITDRSFGGSVAGVSNILNITDGIMGSCLGIQIIATFNMEKKKIDQALLRKGRLILEHKFDKLNVNDSNKLLDHLGKNYQTKEPMTLSEIYNIDEEFYKMEDKREKIGFI